MTKSERRVFSGNATLASRLIGRWSLSCRAVDTLQSVAAILLQRTWGAVQAVLLVRARVADLAGMLFAPVPKVTLVETSVEDLGTTSRGEGGFGSTGQF